MRTRAFAIATTIAALATLAAGCGSDAATIVVGPPRDTTTTTGGELPDVAALDGLDTELIVEGLSEPVATAVAPGIEDTFVVERTGRVISLASGRVVLDLTSAIGWEVNEQGLLGFAVPPEFPSDPRGFAVYTNGDFDLIVAAHPWNGAVFDASDGSTVLEVPQPHKYHQGGGIRFGPAGYLWLSFGDGGGIGDRYGNGQDPKTLNGTIVRIDVDNGDPYAIPPDNPYVGSDAGAPEVWAHGLRNPWRFAIDRDLVVIADVGQYGSEEVNVVRLGDSGRNFGWPIMEADECYEAESCDDTGMTAPVLVVPHERACAIIGGPVYRGTAIPELHGHYVYGDHCVGWLRTAPLYDDGSFGPITDWERELGDLGQITSIDIDDTGELIVTNLEGQVLRIVAVRTND